MHTLASCVVRTRFVYIKPDKNTFSLKGISIRPTAMEDEITSRIDGDASFLICFNVSKSNHWGGGELLSED